MICSLDANIITQLLYVLLYILRLLIHSTGGNFSILIEKKVSYIFLHLIFNSCIRQKACVAWGIFRSQYLNVTIYIDKVLVMLRTTGIRGHIGSAYIGTLSYADDITLLCPSVRGLNEMIVLCCEYAN